MSLIHSLHLHLHLQHPHILHPPPPPPPSKRHPPHTTTQTITPTHPPPAAQAHIYHAQSHTLSNPLLLYRTTEPQSRAQGPPQTSPPQENSSKTKTTQKKSPPPPKNRKEPTPSQSLLTTLKLLRGFNKTPIKLGSWPVIKSSVLELAVLLPPTGANTPVGNGGTSATPLLLLR